MTSLLCLDDSIDGTRMYFEDTDQGLSDAYDEFSEKVIHWINDPDNSYDHLDVSLFIDRVMPGKEPEDVYSLQDTNPGTFLSDEAIDAIREYEIQNGLHNKFNL